MDTKIKTYSANQINSDPVLYMLKQSSDITTELVNERFISDADSTLFFPDTTNSSLDNFSDVTSIGCKCVLDHVIGCSFYGSNGSANYTENLTCIGSAFSLTGTGANKITNMVIVGESTTLTANAQSPTNAVILGNNTTCENISNCVLIGNDLGGGDALKNTIVTSTNPLRTTNGKTPVEGSLIFQVGESTDALNGGQPSTKARIQFLGDKLLNLRGENVGDAFDANAVAFDMPQINGFMRIKYKNVPLLIPVILDSEANADVAISANVVEFVP